MKKFTGVEKMYLNKYIIPDSTVFICKKCGEEVVELEECERIQKKIAAIEKKAKIPAVHQMMAKVKYFVL